MEKDIIKNYDELDDIEKIHHNYLMICIEKAKKDNKMEKDISWEECYDRFEKVLSLYSSYELNAWDYFISIYNDIPQEHRLKIMLLGIYTYYDFTIAEFYQFLKRILDDETKEQRKDRMKVNKKILKKYLDKQNFIILYRGVCNYSFDEEYAISYTVNKSKAEWFANRFPSEYKKVIKKEFHLSDILLCTNNRKERSNGNS